MVWSRFTVCGGGVRGDLLSLPPTERDASIALCFGSGKVATQGESYRLRTSAAPACGNGRHQDRACQYRHNHEIAQVGAQEPPARRSWGSLRSARLPPMHYLDKLPRPRLGQIKQDGSELNRRTSPRWVTIQPALTDTSHTRGDNRYRKLVQNPTPVCPCIPVY
jgi:hypothetical protein